MLFQKIFNHPSPQPIPTSETCPNCWGHSQWQGEDRPPFFDLDKGACTEVRSRNGFIRRFVKKYLG